MTIQEFIDTHNITFTYAPTDANPDMADFDGDHYICGFYRGDDLFTVHFSKGLGHEGTPPEPLEVMECLQMDASLMDGTRDFDDFCDSLGYDPDSRSAERVYEACKSQTERLRVFLGDALFDTLLECEEE
jgi:hypothetical protein